MTLPNQNHDWTPILQKLHSSINVRARSFIGGNLVPFRFAVAISGGVDSMALAVLCSRLSRLKPNLQFTGFIVDHKARQNSDEEANVVASRLRHLGFRTRILPLHWPAPVHPSSLADFETQARKLRYQALGKECVRMNIHRLLMAHHMDDQVESILMGIAERETGMCLPTIKPTAGIPECWGIHGVNSSGRYESAKRRVWRLGHICSHGSNNEEFSLELIANAKQQLASKPVLERGGVSVVRPLLDLELDKDSLKRICESAGVEWVEDPTNADPTQTPRNAVRILLKSGHLPEALSKESLIALFQRHKTRSIRANANFHFAEQCCEVLKLDVRSGMMKVRMARELDSVMTMPIPVSKGYKCHVAAMILDNFISSVSPFEKVKWQGLGSIARAMFSELNESTRSPPSGPECYTASGVRLEKICEPSTVHKATSSPNTSKSSEQMLPLDPDHVWILSRQPFLSVPLHITFRPRSATRGAAILSKRKEDIIRSKGRYNDKLSPWQTEILRGWSPWSLWDGRYWLRLKNNSAIAVILRALLPEDLDTIKSSLDPQKWEALRDVLREAAPNKVRWTLPAIVSGMSGRPEVVSLPSLGKVGNFVDAFDDKFRELEWDIRYKNVDLRSGMPARLKESDKESVNIRHDKKIMRSWEDS